MSKLCNERECNFAPRIAPHIASRLCESGYGRRQQGQEYYSMLQLRMPPSSVGNIANSHKGSSGRPRKPLEVARRKVSPGIRIFNSRHPVRLQVTSRWDSTAFSSDGDCHIILGIFIILHRTLSTATRIGWILPSKVSDVDWASSEVSVDSVRRRSTSNEMCCRKRPSTIGIK